MTVRGRRCRSMRWLCMKCMAPATRSSPKKQQYALAILKGVPKGKQYEWWVDDVRFPYKPKSYVAPAKAPDDGHGHAH